MRRAQRRVRWMACVKAYCHPPPEESRVTRGGLPHRPTMARTAPLAPMGLLVELRTFVAKCQSCGKSSFLSLKVDLRPWPQDSEKVLKAHRCYPASDYLGAFDTSYTRCVDYLLPHKRFGNQERKMQRVFKPNKKIDVGVEAIPLFCPPLPIICK